MARIVRRVRYADAFQNVPDRSAGGESCTWRFQAVLQSGLLPVCGRPDHRPTVTIGIACWSLKENGTNNSGLSGDGGIPYLQRERGTELASMPVNLSAMKPFKISVRHLWTVSYKVQRFEGRKLLSCRRNWTAESQVICERGPSGE
jgi:hypothetical protein